VQELPERKTLRAQPGRREGHAPQGSFRPPRTRIPSSPMQQTNCLILKLLHLPLLSGRLAQSTACRQRNLEHNRLRTQLQVHQAPQQL